ncbi:MAG: hypothetical protein LUC91_03650 [Prevotella sp.]|nr:hypothetical protein [Prevotella sp.]
MDTSKMYFPVEAINRDVMAYTLTFNELFQDTDNEALTNKLSRTIKFEMENKLVNIAEIRHAGEEYQIVIYLPFAQFLWSTGLYMNVMFDNKIQIPMMNRAGTNVHSYEPDQAKICFAEDTFEAAMTLKDAYNRELFFMLPNICNPMMFSECIDKANTVYANAIAFVFAHELAHNFLGHTRSDSLGLQSVEEEQKADAVALSYFEKYFNLEGGFNNKIGVAALLCALLLLDKESINGGFCHPHMDDRIESLMNKLQLPEADILWGYVGAAIRLWLLQYGGFTKEEESKDFHLKYYWHFYKYYLDKLREVRQRRYPTHEAMP